jgi:hypothetical protein
MPIVCRFYGIVIAIFYDDHGVPHFHAVRRPKGVHRDRHPGEPGRLALNASAGVGFGMSLASSGRVARELAARSAEGAAPPHRTVGVNMGMTSWEDVVAVSHLDGYRLRLRFADGAEGAVDIDKLVPFEGVFAALGDPAVFAEVRVDAESGTIVWPNGADIAPESLYAAAIGKKQTASPAQP